MELGDLEDTVRRFAEMLGWNDEIEELMRSQETLVGPILKILGLFYECYHL